MTINRKWRCSLQDTRVKHSADVGSDYHRVIAELKIKLLAVKKVRSTWYRMVLYSQVDTSRSQGCHCTITV